MSAEQNTTTIFPFPIDLFKPFFELMKDEKKGKGE
jgi:hypothetical protein